MDGLPEFSCYYTESILQRTKLKIKPIKQSVIGNINDHILLEITHQEEVCFLACLIRITEPSLLLRFSHSYSMVCIMLLGLEKII